MRGRKVVVPMLLFAMILLAACSGKQKEGITDRVPPDQRCGNYKIDRDNHTIDNGLPKAGGVRGEKGAVHCKLEIVAMQDIYPPDYRGPKAPRMPLDGLPSQITDRMWVREWINVISETPIKEQHLILPAYTFQCWINEDNDATFECRVEVVGNHRLTNYTEQAFEITAGGLIPTGVDLKLGVGYGESQKELRVKESGTSMTGKLNSRKSAVWTALLVLHTEWDRIGIAEVCFDNVTVHCDIVKARAIHTEDILLDHQTEAWPTIVNAFRGISGQPSLGSLQPPLLPPLRSDYENGPQRKLMGDVMTGMAAVWKNTDSRLQKQDLTGSISIGILKADAGLTTGQETELTSSALIAYEIDPKKAAPGVRCMEILSVGGSASDQPITGMIFKEGCSY